MSERLQEAIEDYLDNHWDEVVADLDKLVRIESVEDLSAPVPGAPFGPGPRKALDVALDIASGMGFATHDCQGYIAYADISGTGDTQVGIIGHVDVVPAGPGWTFPPFQVSRKDGYLLGRGVADDKGPLVVALHAAKLWHDLAVEEGRASEHTLRILFGANEETNMKDVAYYRQHHADPTFLFTPDAEFPVCYGESGICSGTLTSEPLAEGTIKGLEGGVAVNAVPGQARALVSCGKAALPPAEKIVLESVVDTALSPEGLTAVCARGKSAHASTPELGENALDILAAYLLETGVLSASEQRFFQLVRKVTACHDGSGLGLATSDDHLGTLTAVGGMMGLEDGCMRLSIDFRYPTTITAREIERRVNDIAQKSGATFTMEHDKEPFLMDPSSAPVQALLAAYNEATGENAEPFTMKGGTYARMFATGVSFGPEKPWEPKPDWVGSMHGPDEGIREDLLKQAFAIYVRTIDKLMSSTL